MKFRDGRTGGALRSARDEDGGAKGGESEAPPAGPDVHGAARQRRLNRWAGWVQPDRHWLIGKNFSENDEDWPPAATVLRAYFTAIFILIRVLTFRVRLYEVFFGERCHVLVDYEDHSERVGFGFHAFEFPFFVDLCKSIRCMRSRKLVLPAAIQ